MAGDCDEWPHGEWPKDDEANDIMLAYVADDDPDSAVSGCAGGDPDVDNCGGCGFNDRFLKI